MCVSGVGILMRECAYVRVELTYLVRMHVYGYELLCGCMLTHMRVCACVCVCVCASALLTTSSSVNHPDELPHVDLLCMCVHFSPWTRFSPSPTLEIHNLFTCCFSMQGHCHIWTSLIEFSSVALSWFTLSGLNFHVRKLIQPVFFNIMGWGNCE